MVEKDNVGVEKSAFGRVFGDMSMITTEPAYKTSAKPKFGRSRRRSLTSSC